MEKFFSVSVEFNDGTTKAVAAHGESASAVYQQMKQLPGVRRVGKVAEVSPDAHESVTRGRPSGSDSHSQPLPRPSEVSLATLNQPLRGPRVVLDARPVGGEQPFRHLQAPPERPRPPRPAVEQAPPARRLEPAAQSAVQITPTLPQPRLVYPVAMPQSPEHSELEYRIVRSRRADGAPYLLQRGTWSQRDGKRSFKLDWEKGFDERAKAERHLQWVQQSALELADVEDDQLNEAEYAESAELAQV